MKPKLKHPQFHPEKDPELKRLAELVGRFIEYWGFKAVQGRMWFYLYVSSEPLSSIELARILKISSALVTQSVQILLRYRVVLPAEKGPNGVLRYRANPNAAEAVGEVLESREAVLMQKIGDSVSRARQELQRGSQSGLKISSDRLNQVGDWVVLFQFMLEMGMSNLRGAINPFSDPDAFMQKLVTTQNEN